MTPEQIYKLKKDVERAKREFFLFIILFVTSFLVIYTLKELGII